MKLAELILTGEWDDVLAELLREYPKTREEDQQHLDANKALTIEERNKSFEESPQLMAALERSLSA